MTTPHIQWSALAPDLILLGGAGFLLLAAVSVQDRRARDLAMFVGMGCFIGSLVAVGVIWDYGGGAWSVLERQFVVDRFANVVRVIVAASGLLTLMGAYGWARLREHGPEFVAFLLVAAAGMDLLAASNSFISLFITLEMFSISLYALCAFETRSSASLEAGLKYLVLGSIGSAILLYGAAFLYGETGSFGFPEIAKGVAARSEQPAGAGRHGARARGPRLQDRDRPVPHVDARRVRGIADAGHRVHVGRDQGGGVRGAVPRARPGPAGDGRRLATRAGGRVGHHHAVRQHRGAAADEPEADPRLLVGRPRRLPADGGRVGRGGREGAAVLPRRLRRHERRLVHASSRSTSARPARPPRSSRCAAGGSRGPCWARRWRSSSSRWAASRRPPASWRSSTCSRPPIDADYTYLAIVGVVSTVISLGYYLRIGLSLYDRSRESSAMLAAAPGTAWGGICAVLRSR